MAKFYIACGGTGGHLYPGLAVAERLFGQGHDVRLFVSPKKIDQEILEGHPEFRHSIVELTGWPGFGPGMAGFAWQFAKAFMASRRLLGREKPKAVLGMGGFSCAPLLMASVLAGIPSYIHESNVIPGKATRLLSPFVSEVLIGFKSCAGHLKGVNAIWTGTPVRTALVSAEVGDVRQEWGIDPGSVVVAVTGGSQGARGLNRLVCESLEGLDEYKASLYFIHLTGDGEDEKCRSVYEKLGYRARVMPFSHEMGKIFGMADVVVARSGAATLTECGWFGLPALLVPYPHAAENHQRFNALEYVNDGGGYLVEEGEGDGDLFLKRMRELISDRRLREEMKKRIKVSRVEDAVGRVVERVTGGVL